MKIYLNHNWKYQKEFVQEMVKQDYDDSHMEVVQIPHTNIELPFHYFDESSYQFVSGYRRLVSIPAEWEGKIVNLTFEGVLHKAQVFCNGKEVMTHKCGYTAFTINLTDDILFGEDNMIAVKVDSTEQEEIPPFGNVIDYLTYGGIYRDVYFEVENKVYMKDVFVTTPEVGKEEKILNFEILFNREEQLEIEGSITDGEGKPIFTFGEEISHVKHAFSYSVRGVHNWSVDVPNLYHLNLLLFHKGQMVDRKSIRFGFRTCEFRKDGFYLNDQKMKLIGLNRHQSFPYVGYAMPKGPQQNDADILKYELCVNAVRTSHYPQSQYFIDRCDEIGLLVFTEIPGWQHIGNEVFKEQSVRNVQDMVMQYRNHPSIILWGVRINESVDDDEFYTRTNEVAHALDQSRQTGGVRYLQKSHLLEDVYTYNDFIHKGHNRGLDKKKKVTADVSKGYLVSEHNGHMFPTKSFDCEEHRLDQALRHARVLDDMFADSENAGAFGWCMFDYNTHKQFGSGDRICYHGVMDMFRNEKIAAAVYASQGEEPTCEVANGMEIGEHPGGNIGDVYVFTNADSVRVYKRNTLIKEYRKEDSIYHYLPHGPLLIDDLIGDQLIENEGFSRKSSEEMKMVFRAIQKYGQNDLPISMKLLMVKLMIKLKLTIEDGIRLFTKYVSDWGGNTSTYRFEAIKDGKVFKTIEKGPQTQTEMEVVIDHTELVEAHTYDVACIRIHAIDQNGNQLSYFQQPIKLSVEGVIEIIGPDIISFQGGSAGTYVRTIGKAGSACLFIEPQGMNGQMNSEKVMFHVTVNQEGNL